MTRPLSSTSPKLAHWLLRRTLPAERYETIAGDLDELFLVEQMPRAGARAARRWFWRQTLSVLSAQARQRFARPSVPGLLDVDADARKGGLMRTLRQDVRDGVRALRKTPGFTAIAVLTLAFGIGGSTAIFTLVQGLLLKPLPFTDPGALMLVHITNPDSIVQRGGLRETAWSYAKYEQLFVPTQQAFQESALVGSTGWTLTISGTDPEMLRGEVIDAHYLSVLGIAPMIGRAFTPADDRAPLVMISHDIWQRRFGGDPSAIGRTIGLNAAPFTIVGILPAGSRGLTGEAQLFVPIKSGANPWLRALEDPWVPSYLLVGRRKPGVSIAQAQAEVNLLGARLDAAFPPPAFAHITGSFGAYAIPFDDSRTDPIVRRAVFVLLGAVGAVLLIGCVNLASLMLTRTVARQREVAIRLAIGATRGRVVRQFLTESLIVAMAGAAAGVLVAIGTMRLAALVLPETNILLPRGGFALTRIGVGLIGLDATTLLFALTLAIVTAVLFGLMPAWQASRADVVHTIKAGGAGSVGRGVGAARLGNLLVIAETAIALVLLVAAGLMLTSVQHLQSARLGFQPDDLIVSWVQLPDARYDRAHAMQFFTRLLDDLRARPGVHAAAYGACAPVSGTCPSTLGVRTDRENAPGASPFVGVIPASPDYFQTLGIRLIKGRTFTDRDREGQPRVLVINETAARRLWPGEDPIGKRLRLTQIYDGDGAEIVGIVADVRYHPVEAAMTPDVYICSLQESLPSGFMFLRTTGDVTAATALMRASLRTLDPDLPLGNVKTMGNRFGESTWRARVSADLLTLFAVLALLLAAIGLYGVTSQAVAARTREIGVRMALGADRAAIFRTVIGRALTIGVMGVILGVGATLMATPALETLLYQVRARDPLTIGVLAIGLLAVTLLASYIPARRATRVDPLTCLRAE